MSGWGACPAAGWSWALSPRNVVRPLGRPLVLRPSSSGCLPGSVIVSSWARLRTALGEERLAVAGVGDRLGLRRSPSAGRRRRWRTCPEGVAIRCGAMRESSRARACIAPSKPAGVADAAHRGVTVRRRARLVTRPSWSTAKQAGFRAVLRWRAARCPSTRCRVGPASLSAARRVPSDAAASLPGLFGGPLGFLEGDLGAASPRVSTTVMAVPESNLPTFRP